MFEYQYPHPAITADCVAFGIDEKDIKVLLIQRKNEPYKGKWAIPGGFMKIDETTEECAKRELFEKSFGWWWSRWCYSPSCRPKAIGSMQRNTRMQNGRSKNYQSIQPSIKVCNTHGWTNMV